MKSDYNSYLSSDEEENTKTLLSSSTSNKISNSPLTNEKISPKTSIFSTFLVHFVLVLIHVLWGFIPVINKWTLEGEYFSAYVFTSLRFIITLPFLCLFILTPKNIVQSFTVQKKIFFLYYFILAVFFASQQNFYMVGTGYTTAANASVLLCISPAFTMFFSILLKREKFIWLKLIGILFCIFGALFVIDLFSFSFSEGGKGDVMIIISAVAYAGYVVGQELLTNITKNSQQVLIFTTFFTMIILNVYSLIFYFDDWNFSVIFSATPLAWAALFYSAVVTTSFCYSLLGWCLKKTSPIVVMAYLPVEPIAASITAYFVFDDPLTHLFFIGGAFLLIGLFFVIIGRHRELKLNNNDNNNNNNNNNIDNNYDKNFIDKIDLIDEKI